MSSGSSTASSGGIPSAVCCFGVARHITLGALEINAPALTDALWVVDGQQRLTSLANVLHPEGQLDERFALGYDLQARVEIRGLSPVRRCAAQDLREARAPARRRRWTCRRCCGSCTTDSRALASVRRNSSEQHGLTNRHRVLDRRTHQIADWFMTREAVL